jgi:hypothetical protein
LHKLLFANTPGGGGTFKSSDNLVVDRSPDGSTQVRFVPVPANQTPFYTSELIDRFNIAVSTDEHHPVLLIGLFVLDLLTIHPFSDGNGRVVRALTNALLPDAGYGVGRYVSLERLIAGSADEYYPALLTSTHGWHDEANNPWPWLEYFVGLIARAYDSFEGRAASDRSTGTKQERVRDYVLHHAAPVFRIADIRVALPGVSDQAIRLALDAMKAEQRIAPEGTGRAAGWRGRMNPVGRTRLRRRRRRRALCLGGRPCCLQTRSAAPVIVRRPGCRRSWNSVSGDHPVIGVMLTSAAERSGPG